MTDDWKSGVVKVMRMMPALFLRDPLFRYAAIAAGIALLFLIAQFEQNLAGPSAKPAAPSASAGGDAGKPQTSAAKPAAYGVSPATSLPSDGASRHARSTGHGYGIGQLFRALAHDAAELRFRSGDHALLLWGDAPSLTGQVELAQKAWLDGLTISVRCAPGTPGRRP